jgi:hypothetical protein
LGKIALISKEHHEQNGTQPPAIQESLIDDQGKELTSEELATVISNWIELKDDPIILEAEIKEALEALERQKEQESNSNSGDDHGADDDNDDDGVSDPTDIEESVNAGGIADFLEAEAYIDAVKPFVRKEGYPQAVLDHLSSIVH